MTEITRETVRTENTDVVVPVKDEVSGSQTAARLIYFIFGILEVLLVFRLLFKLTGASHGSMFVDLIYSITGIFVMPFTGIFRQATTTGVETTAILEPATIVAIIVYILIAWGIVKLIGLISKEQSD